MSSLYSDVLTAVKSRLLTAPGLGLTRVYIRKHPRLAESDTLPAITVSPGNESEVEEHSENVVQLIYPVYVTIWQASNQSLESNVTAMLDYREIIRRAFHKSSPLGLGRIIEGNVNFTSTFDPQLFDVNLDASQLELLFLSQEQRDDSSGDPGIPP